MASYTYFAVELGDNHALGCKCCRFKTGHDLPVPKELTNDEIADLARKFSHQIFADYTQLNAILKRYEEVVQKRWMKKNDKKRRAILLQAWPNMAPTHRPDFVSFRKGSRIILARRHLLLLFINSRGRNLPDKFVSADIQAAHLGKGWQFCADSERDVTKMFSDLEKRKDSVAALSFHGAHNPRSYGQLVLCDSTEHLEQSVSSYPPNLGLLVLEIQQGIYSFLLTCVKLILHDVEPINFLIAPHQAAPSLQQQLTNDWSSFSAHQLEASYRVPQILNLERIKTLVSARRSAAEDHFWLLREDPAYFLDTLLEWKEHDAVIVKHTCSHCFNAVAARMVTDAFTYFYLWSQISLRLERMPPLEDQIRRANAEHLRLPEAEERLWAEILEIVNFLKVEPVAALRIGVPPSPRLRHCFNLPESPRHGDKEAYVWSAKAKISDAERRIIGLVYAIIDPEQRELHTLNHIIQEFQYMMDTDPASAELVDSWTNSQFADLAMLSELQLRIEGLQPWSTSWRSQKVHRTDPVKRRLDSLFSTVEIDVRECIYCIATEFGYELLVNPFDGRLDYPATKVNTKANITQMRRAEKALDGFWKEIDDDMKATAGRTLTAIMKACMSTTREKHRTKPWKETSKAATPKRKPVLQKLDTNVTIPHAASSSKLDVDLPTPKVKVKTRGVASSPASVEPDPRTPTPEQNTPLTPTTSPIKVSKRAFKTLDALIPAPNSSSHQHAEIAWNELLAAMDEIGLQPEKLYGSVWVFKPREDGKAKVDVSRSISFHEPKEVRRGHKIPTNMVRTFGRRLKHAFGWWDGMFACA